MWFRNQCPAAILALVVVFVTGCDPGCAYTPVDMNGNTVKVWESTVNGVRFQHEGFFDLIPVYVLNGRLKVLNGSEYDVRTCGVSPISN
jgi:hypothetical protein